MKGNFGLYVFAVCSIFPTYFTISWTLYAAGSWCPYQVEKIVPCRVRNGTEPYYGTNICWRNENGSYACTKKLMYRPKYTTVYKKIMETKYRCCPGRDGPDCQNECFNCTTFRKLEDRLVLQERRLGRLEKSLLLQKSNTAAGAGMSLGGSDRFHRDYSSENSVYSAGTLPSASSFAQDSEGTPGSSLSLAYSTLNRRVQTILDDFREMQNRIRDLEDEVARLNAQVEDLSVNSNLAYDYSGGSNNNAVSGQHAHKDSRNHLEASGATVNKDNPPLLQREMTRNGDSSDNEAGESGVFAGGDQDHVGHETHYYRHAHNRHRHHQHHPNSDVPSSTPPTQPHHHFSNHHSAAKTDNTPFRVLEENLERGDIASTLNDDYGDDLYNDNSTEQYIDQLQAKREHQHHLP